MEGFNHLHPEARSMKKLANLQLTKMSLSFLRVSRKYRNMLYRDDNSLQRTNTFPVQELHESLRSRSAPRTPIENSQPQG